MKVLTKNFELKKLILFFFISSYFALIIKDNLISENSFVSTFYLYGYIYLIIFVQIFILAIFKKKLLNILFIVFLFYNFYSLNLSINSEFTILQGKEKLFRLIIFFLAFLLLIFFIFKNQKIFKPIIILYFLFNIVELFSIQKYINIILLDDKRQTVEFINDKFIKKPNIYIWSIESLSNNFISKNHIGIEKTLYMDFFDKSGFVVLKNHFSDDYATRNSLNSLLGVDQNFWKKNKKDYFSGRDEAPLFKLLKKNNYKIITGYHDSHFGPGGKYVDEYLTFRSIKVKNKNYQKYYVNYCQFKMPWYHSQMFNYCELLKNIFKIKNSEKLTSKDDFENYTQTYIGKDDFNKFVVFHQLTHSHPSPDTKNWKNVFKEARKKNIDLIKNLSEKIIKEDPNSILIIIGDHGPSLLKMSTEAEFHKNILKTHNNDEKISYVIDRFYTVGTVLDNNNYCSDEISNLSNQKFTTNSMLLNEILRCMLGGDNLTKSPLEYSIPSYKNTPLEKGGNYEDFIILK